MFLRRSAVALTRRTLVTPIASRPFTSSFRHLKSKDGDPMPGQPTSSKVMVPFEGKQGGQLPAELNRKYK